MKSEPLSLRRGDTLEVHFGVWKWRFKAWRHLFLGL